MTRLPLMIALDVDGNGAISAEEVQNAPLTLRKLDRNSDGALTVDELLPETMSGAGGGGLLGGLPGMIGGPGSAIDPAQLAARLMAADANSDGFIDKTETPAPMQQMFARADLDRDGKLSREEVTQLTTQLSERRGRNNSATRGDVGSRDAGARDLGTRDAGARDAGARDAGARDAGARDVGGREAGTAPAGDAASGTRPGANARPQ